MNKSEPSTLMTSGPIWKKILFFSFPLFLGNLFQQLYNTADSVIVGNYISSNALAAVSSSSHLIFFMVGFFQGLAMGAGVVIARYYGARDLENLHKAVHTTVALGLFASGFLTVFGVTMAPKILVLMGTPAEVLPESVTYFQIFFAGSLGLIMYNVFVGILQSVGDSKTPLYYLIISSLCNVALDLLFIPGFHMGVGAAALATVISQFLSALLCLRKLLHAPEDYRLSVKKICIHRDMFTYIMRNGIPSGLQNSIISIANVFVQSNINSFGKMAVAGCGAYSKIEGFVFLPVSCFTMALATFVSQNIGARQYERAKKGARFGLGCSLLTAEFIGLVIFFAAPVFIRAFNSDPQVILYGTSQSRIEALFYFLLAFSHCVASILRGSGRATVPMVIMLLFWCLVRISYISIVIRIIPVIQVVFWAYPLTWSLSSIVFFFYYKKSDWVHSADRI